MTRWTAEAIAQLQQRCDAVLSRPKRQKYGAKPVTIDGVRFASKREAERFQMLKLLERAGQIRALKPHPVYEFIYNGVRIGRYTADSRYEDFDGDHWFPVVEDVKSRPTRTEAYGLRKRMMLAFFGIAIREYL